MLAGPENHLRMPVDGLLLLLGARMIVQRHQGFP
jgi:hypothetical protein